jgi:transcriptional regulator
LYTPSYFKAKDFDQIVAFMQQYDFVCMNAVIDGRIHSVHLPVLVQVAGQQVIIQAHLSADNALAHLAAGNELQLVFQGPHAYISPSLYSQTNSVPTWNYIAVHAYGAFEPLQADIDKLSVLQASIQKFEPAYFAQWERLPKAYIDAMLPGLLAFQVKVNHLEASFKLSQNKPEADRQRIAETLLQSADSQVKATGEWMLQGNTAPNPQLGEAS